MHCDASIVLLTFNGERYLAQVLEMIRHQNQPPREIIAIDSGSTDGTLDILQQTGITLHQIPNAEFSHPKTRNLGAQMAQGKYVVFLTQDATPADSCWLEQLLKPFEEFPHVAGTFSRQVPRPGADLLEAGDVTVYFKRTRQIKTKPEDQKYYRKKISYFVRYSCFFFTGYFT